MYLARFEDGKGNVVHEEHFESFDNATAFIRDNPSFRLRHSLKSMVLKGALRPNDVRWRTARLLDLKEDGSQVEVRSYQQGRW